MLVLVLSAASPEAAVLPDDPALDEEHWAYMDRFAAGMVARGPTLAADRETWTGSVHVVDLPSAQAARSFVEDEPYHRAGRYAQHRTWRFEDRLGRTMWEFPGEAGDPRSFVVLEARAGAGGRVPAVAVPEPAALPREQLIVLGALRTLDEGAPAGVALAVQAPTREAVGALLRAGWPDLDDDVAVRVHPWEFGGRR